MSKRSRQVLSTQQFSGLNSWKLKAKVLGLLVKAPSTSDDWTHDAFDSEGSVRGRFMTSNVPQNSRGFINTFL